MKDKISSQVTVDLSVRVCVDSTWGEKTTIAQVHRQAKEEAERIVKKALAGKVRILEGETVNVFSQVK